MKVYNATKHAATEQQIKDGAIDVPQIQESSLSLFTEMPSNEDLGRRANAIVKMAMDAGAKRGDGLLIAGAMYFIDPMRKSAIRAGLVPVFSFTQRMAVEQPDGKGGVDLSYKFVHEGWIKG